MVGSAAIVVEVDPMASKEIEPIFDVAANRRGTAELAAQSVQHETCVNGGGTKGADVDLIGVGALVYGPRPFDHRVYSLIESLPTGIRR